MEKKYVSVTILTFAGITGMHESFLAAIDDKCQIKMTQLNTASTLACCCAGMPFYMENIVAKGWVRF